jgi:hypothetical protein
MHKLKSFSNIPEEWITEIKQTRDTQQIGCVVLVSTDDDGGSTWKATGPIACCCIVNEGLDTVRLSIPTGQNLHLQDGWGLSAC